MGTHEIAIWALVDNTSPQIRSDTLATPVILKFKVLMINTNCMNGVITAPVLQDMDFEIMLPWNPTIQKMPLWTHPITPECDKRTHVLSGTAFDKGILTFDGINLTVKTPYAYNIGTFTATVTTDIADIPFLIPLLRVSASFTVKITARCESTKLLPNILVNKLTYVGDKPVVWKVNEWQDTVSNSVIQYSNTIYCPSDVWTINDGPFCQDRLHKVVAIESPNKAVLIKPPVVQLNDEYLFFTLNAPDKSYEGVHKITIEVILFDYKNWKTIASNTPLK